MNHEWKSMEKFEQQLESKKRSNTIIIPEYDKLKTELKRIMNNHNIIKL